MFERKGDEKIMLQFIDISQSILYDMEKAQNQVLSMINACVSHEMRNPLNSIIAQNMESKHVCEEIKDLVTELREEKIDMTYFLV